MFAHRMRPSSAVAQLLHRVLARRSIRGGAAIVVTGDMSGCGAKRAILGAFARGSPDAQVGSCNGRRTGIDCC